MREPQQDEQPQSGPRAPGTVTFAESHDRKLHGRVAPRKSGAARAWGQDRYRPSPENLAAREWFQEAKVGLFINPVRFDPAKWVALAKSAGARYITLITKHHDGFALFDSEVSEWDTLDRTPCCTRSNQRCNSYGSSLLTTLALGRSIRACSTARSRTTLVTACAPPGTMGIRLPKQGQGSQISATSSARSARTGSSSPSIETSAISPCGTRTNQRPVSCSCELFRKARRMSTRLLIELLTRADLTWRGNLSVVASIYSRSLSLFFC